MYGGDGIGLAAPQIGVSKRLITLDVALCDTDDPDDPDDPDDEEEAKAVAYGNIIAVLIEAMKEQQAQIEALEARLNAVQRQD